MSTKTGDVQTAQRCRDSSVAVAALVLVIDGADLDLHVALFFVTQYRLALVVERAAGKACYLQQVRQFMVTP